jgi:peptide/nickel transport system substrate-binding protein
MNIIRFLPLFRHGLLACLLLGLAATHAALADTPIFLEPPALEAKVRAGTLPPVAMRLPEHPLVYDVKAHEREPGRYGGEWRTLIYSAKDVKLLTVYGYARLVGYNERFELVPDILEAVTIEDGRVFTLKLRKGHKWSDGAPFTAEDFRYYWEDVANNEELSPSGPPRELVIEGEPAKVEILDELTVRYSWSHRNPFFLPALASPAPLFIYRPAHYLKQFHTRYGVLEEAGKKGAGKKDSAMRNWAAKHNNLDNMYKFDNPDLPTLGPWINTTRPPATRFVARRNPYFHRVDEVGHQLPYIDQVTLTIADSKLIPAKAGAGESDLQARSLAFSDYTFLKEGEKRNNYTVRLWHTANAAHLALYPNLTIADPVWRGVLRDVRFRRALSLATNRHEINQVMYYGLGLEGGNTVLPGSPLYTPDYRMRWCQYDPGLANQLLDEMGLDKRADDDIRLLPDGRRAEIIIETAGEDTEQTDVLELVRDAWLKIGIKVFTKPSQREVFRNRIYAGETLMSIWAGMENGLVIPDMSPGEYAPTMQTSLQWSQWGQHYETSGQAGEPPDLPEAKELLELNERWLNSISTDERRTIWQRILTIHASEVFTIGLIGGVLQPILISNRMHNVPAEGIYNWDPGAHFGLYHPDIFWFDDGPTGGDA